jgi:TatD family hydrolase
VQRDYVFAVQIALALELDRPVAIHTREAMADTMAVLREAGAGRLRGVMHCFSGTQDEARQALDIGFYISIAGIVTFNKADALREMARLVPDDRLLVETDAPFLAPSAVSRQAQRTRVCRGDGRASGECAARHRTRSHGSSPKTSPH